MTIPNRYLLVLISLLAIAHFLFTDLGLFNVSLVEASENLQSVSPLHDTSGVQTLHQTSSAAVI